MKRFILAESPMAYRRHFIFTEADAPRSDAEGRPLVGLRNDADRLVPEPVEIEPLRRSVRAR